MLLISVPAYEEQIDSNGSLVTYYVVNVEDTVSHLRYALIKRYSAFAALKDILKEKYPEVLKRINYSYLF